MIHNRKLNRMQGYNYARDNYYFITICVDDKHISLGKISGSKMLLNPLGEIIQTQWLWLADQYPYIILHEFIIMPDMHGIIEINRNSALPNSGPLRTGCDLSLPLLKLKSLSEIIGAFKTTSSKKIHLAGFEYFKWQRSFHDRIIRDHNAFWNIINYIRNNPKNYK